MSDLPWLQSVVTLAVLEDDRATLDVPHEEASDGDSDVATLAGDQRWQALMHGPESEDGTMSSHVVLTFERDDPQHTRLYTNRGITMYTIATHAEKDHHTRSLVTTLRTAHGQMVASYVRPAKRGAEHVVMKDHAPVKRSNWLTTGKPFSNSIGIFKHGTNQYKWIKRREQTGIVLELHSSSEDLPIAQYIDSRRDWSVPPPSVVVHKARLELTPAALEIMDICIFSWVVTEMLQRERTPSSLAIGNCDVGSKGTIAFYI